SDNAGRSFARALPPAPLCLRSDKADPRFARALSAAPLFLRSDKADPRFARALSAAASPPGRSGGRGALVEALSQRVPGQRGALDPHRELHHPLQRLEITEL